jgi:cyanophycinase
MNDRFLFLFGGNPSLFEANHEFVAASGGNEAKIALLFTYSVEWERYLPHYVNPWKEIGIHSYSLVMPDEHGRFDYEKTAETLNAATGIYIGGGNTQSYYRHYASSPMKELIKERYSQGVPVAGCSAGALISLSKSFIFPDETKDNHLEIIEGIGLLSDALIGVHYTEENQHPYLVKAMEKLSIQTGYGIDENACAVFKNEKHVLSIGDSVHRL